MEEKETTSCKFCKEEILSAAIKCKHCGEDQCSTTIKKNEELLGMLLLIIPVVTTLLVWLWVGNMNLLQSPSSKLRVLMLLTIIGTAILGAIEANQLGVGNKDDLNEKGKKGSGPVAWFFVIVFLWIIAYPAYLYHRSKYGRKNLLIGGILIALVFTISLFAMDTAIDAQMEELRRILNP